jgi:hypothetical protein
MSSDIATSGVIFLDGESTAASRSLNEGWTLQMGLELQLASLKSMEFHHEN